MEKNKIYLGDAYKLIKEIPDKSVDLIITDPPYEMETRGAGFHNKRDYYDLIHDKGLAVGINNSMLDEITRIMKKINLYVFCNKNQIRQYLNYFNDKNIDILVWHKKNPIPTINNKYLSDLEYILFIRDEGVKMFNTYETSSKLFQTNVNKRDKELYNHPTIKPIEIIKTLIMNSTEENSNSNGGGLLILDPFVGSGTTCVAAKELGRNFIGFELNEEYYKIACDRLNGINQKGEMDLFNTNFEQLDLFGGSDNE